MRCPRVSAELSLRVVDVVGWVSERAATAPVEELRAQAAAIHASNGSARWDGSL